MNVTDINGFTLSVSDLQGAIQQSKEFKGFGHTDTTFSEFDKRQRLYWADLHDKLLQLQSELGNQNQEIL